MAQIPALPSPLCFTSEPANPPSLVHSLPSPRHPQPGLTRQGLGTWALSPGRTQLRTCPQDPHLIGLPRPPLQALDFSFASVLPPPCPGPGQGAERGRARRQESQGKEDLHHCRVLRQQSPALHSPTVSRTSKAGTASTPRCTHSLTRTHPGTPPPPLRARGEPCPPANSTPCHQLCRAWSRAPGIHSCGLGHGEEVFIRPLWPRLAGSEADS